jgi:hypothetical protein
MSDEAPRSRAWILFAAVGLVAVAGVIALILYAGRGGSESSSTEVVRIEIRAMPTAKITVDGRAAGTTPMNLQFKKSTREVEIQAEITEQWFKPGVREPYVKTYTPTRRIKLDHDQVIDFTRKTQSD